MSLYKSKTNLNKQVNKLFIDKYLLIILILFAIISITTIYLAYPIMPSYTRVQNLHLRQGLWYILSFVLLAILIKIGNDRLFSSVRIVYWLLNISLALLLVDKFFIDLPFIKPVNGTTAWYQFPGIGSFQPSEFMKIVLIIEVGICIYKHNLEKTENSFASDINLFIKVLKIIALPIILIYLQPESGIILIMIFSFAIMLAISGIRKEWIVIGLVVGAIGFFTIIYLFYYHPTLLGKILGDTYKLNRFYGWLQSEDYILTHGNQLYTSLLTIGSSGMTGHELGQVLISFPEPHTDFIFTSFSQNFGFIGSLSLIILIAIFDLRLIFIAYNFKNSPEKIIIAGLVGMLMFQQLQNIGMVLGLVPITGITLPFISYGGSSMISYFIPLSIAFNMSSYNKSKLLH